jgi:hypothetical protein
VGATHCDLTFLFGASEHVAEINRGATGTCTTVFLKFEVFNQSTYLRSKRKFSVEVDHS